MKTLILYRSNCGHTKRYVDALRTRILADEVIEFKHYSPLKYKDFDTIIYMAPLRNNVIIKLDKFIKHYEKLKDKNIIIGAVGISCVRMDDYTKHLIITTNDLDEKHVRLYFLPGGIDLSLMPKMKRYFFKKTLLYSATKTDQPGVSVGVENLVKNGIDYTNVEYLDRMVTVINKLKELEGK